MYCDRCGTEIGAGSLCPNCGVYSDGPVYRTVHSGARRVNKYTYAILAILFGGFGVHKFYAGKATWGIVYLLLCWTFVPGILGVIEGILALMKDTGYDDSVEVDPERFLL